MTHDRQMADFADDQQQEETATEVTHDRQMADFADRVLVIKDGVLQ